MSMPVLLHVKKIVLIIITNAVSACPRINTYSLAKVFFSFRRKNAAVPEPATSTRFQADWHVVCSIIWKDYRKENESFATTTSLQ